MFEFMFPTSDDSFIKLYESSSFPSLVRGATRIGPFTSQPYYINYEKLNYGFNEFFQLFRENNVVTSFA